MARSFPPLTFLRFDVKEHGWSHLEIAAAGAPPSDRVLITASHVLSDPCENLMLFCERVLTREFGATARFWEEPDTAILKFSVEASIPLLEVSREVEGISGRRQVSEVLVASVNPMTFVAFCIGEFKRLAFLSAWPDHMKDRPVFPCKSYRSLLARWETMVPSGREKAAGP